MLPLLVSAFAAFWLTLFIAATVWETRAARRCIREWGMQVGLQITRFGGGGFQLCPMSEWRATRVYHVFATFYDDQPVRGWVLCRSGGTVAKAVLSPSSPGGLTAADLNSFVNRGLSG